MKRFVEAADRGQSTLFPESLEDWIGEDNPVGVIDVFVDELDLADPWRYLRALARPSCRPVMVPAIPKAGYRPPISLGLNQ